MLLLPVLFLGMLPSPSQYFNVPFLCFFSLQGLIYNDMSLVIISSFHIKDKLVAEIGADGAVPVQPPLLPGLPMLGPQGHSSSRCVPAPNHVEAQVTGLGFEEPPAVMPDLGVLPAVGRGAHTGRPGVSNTSSDRQVLVLGPVPDPDVHCRLLHRTEGTNCFPSTERCPIWDLIGLE